MRSITLTLFAALLLFAAPVRADEISQAQQQAQTLLEGKGLTLRGNMYVLPVEAELPRIRAEYNRARQTHSRAEAEYRRFERDLNRARSLIADREYHLERLRGNTQRAQTAQQHNRLVDEINELSLQLRQMTEERDKREQEAQLEWDDAQAAYIGKAMEIAEQLGNATEQYESLAADEEVTSALRTITEESGRRVTLGPTADLQRFVRMIQRETEGIQAGVIRLRREGNTFKIDVRMNDQITREMTLDTGASAISLPFDLANALGLGVTPDDEMVRVQLADGRLVDAALKTLESVQVGQFIVRDVECLVLPQELTAATPLLGNTFLNHFQFRLDPDRSELNLIRLSADEAEQRRRPRGSEE